MGLEVPKSANSNQPAQRPLPDVDPQWLLMAAAHMQSIGRFNPGSDTQVQDMIRGGYEQLGMKPPTHGPADDPDAEVKRIRPSGIPDPSKPMAPEGQAFPPAKPPHIWKSG